MGSTRPLRPEPGMENNKRLIIVKLYQEQGGNVQDKNVSWPNVTAPRRHGFGYFLILSFHKSTSI